MTMTQLTRLTLAACATLGATAAVAIAAGAPTAVTQAPTEVAATSATFNGTVSPNGNETTYYFQYGTTTAYGSQTPTQGAIQGNADRSVSAAVTGLAPSTTYHYRLIATNVAGTSTGADMAFTTPAPGASPDNALSIVPSARNVTFGGKPVTFSGTLTGANNAGVTVTLEQNPYPYTGGFKAAGPTATTDATGNWSIMISPAENTHYRAVAKTKKPTQSAEVAVRVKVKVTLKIGDRTPRIGQRVWFTGSVLPAHDGKVARIQRRTASGAWRTIATATLKTATPVGSTPRSTYAKRLRIRRNGTYRVRVAPGDGNHIAGNSGRKSVTVH